MAALNRKAAARISRVLQSEIDRGRIPGAVFMVALGGHVELFEALGRRDPATGDAMATDSIFRIYSMTKPLVSLAAMMLMEEGRLQPNDPVSRYLPVFRNLQVLREEGRESWLEPAWREPTVHDLLRHTAGFTYEFLGSSAVQRQYQEADINRLSRTNMEMCEVLAGIPLAHQPGSCFQYSRATDVLGAVLEDIESRPLSQILRERLFDPLGMRDTGFSVPARDWGRVAEPFAKDPESGLPVTMLEVREAPRYESGGGGLMSTAADYARFLLLMRNRGALEGTRLLSRKAVEWMTADHLGDISINGDLLLPGYGFGLGFAVRRTTGVAPQPGSPGQYFWSGIGGTSFFIDPQEDLFAMLLTQAPNQRIHFRNLFRHLVYGAID